MVRGNTVLAPKRPHREVEKKQVKKNNSKKVKSKFIIIRNIVMAFIIGIVLVGRYCAIYNMQKQLNTTKTNITELNKQNDNLKVELVKYNNIQYIEETAVSKLKMVAPDKNKAVFCNISQDKINTVSKTVTSDKGIGGKLTKVIDNMF